MAKMFADIYQISGTLSSSTGLTEVCPLPSGYTEENTIVLDAMFHRDSTSKWFSAFAIQGNNYVQITDDGVLSIYNGNDTNCGNEYRITIAHL